MAEISPCEGIAISQDVFEGVLRDHVSRQQGATFSVNTEFLGLTRTASAVRARLLDRNTGSTFAVSARYLVGADGWRSAVRCALGSSMAGPDDLGTNRAITFRADLTNWLDNPRRRWFDWWTHRRSCCALTSISAGSSWCPTASDLPAAPAAVVRAALGLDDLPLEVLTDGRWTAARRPPTGSPTAGLPRRGRGAPGAPRRRDRNQFRDGGRPQPGVEADGACCTVGPTSACWTATPPSGGRSR